MLFADSVSVLKLSHVFVVFGQLAEVITLASRRVKNCTFSRVVNSFEIVDELSLPPVLVTFLTTGVETESAVNVGEIDQLSVSSLLVAPWRADVEVESVLNVVEAVVYSTGLADAGCTKHKMKQIENKTVKLNKFAALKIVIGNLQKIRDKKQFS